MADVGMEMRVMGSPTYYPLIEAGNNWYDSKASCEFILDDTEELVFIVKHVPQTGEKKGRNDAARYSVASGQDYQITAGITVYLIYRM